MSRIKIAAVSKDGTTISRHFGRAPYYIVVTVEEDKIVSREQRDKPSHSHSRAHSGHHEHDPHEPGAEGYGPGATAQDHHARMAAPISDCEVVLARGMGTAAYESLRQAGLRPIITDVAAIDEAIQAYLDGSLVDHKERLH